MNKSNFMRIVRAFLKLATTHPDDTDALEQARREAQEAKEALSQEREANRLTDSEQAEVQEALDAVSVSVPQDNTPEG